MIPHPCLTLLARVRIVGWKVDIESHHQLSQGCTDAHHSERPAYAAVRPCATTIRSCSG